MAGLGTVIFLIVYDRRGLELPYSIRPNTEWVKKLREEGVVAAHANDGWVDRERNRLQFVYPIFIETDRLKPGAIIAIGDALKYKLVEITKHEESPLVDYWYFRPVSEVA